MAENLYAELNDRSILIFKKLVESYLKTGSPAGSETLVKTGGFNLSSASIRSILSNLEKEGLLFAPHRSAGRMPTEKGMRFFVEGLLEFGRISKTEMESIKQQCSSKGKSYEEVLDLASKAISGLSNYAGIVIAPKFQKNIKHLEFIRLNEAQLMLILAYENGEVENRIIEDKGKYSNSLLVQASNYLTSRFGNKNISQIKKTIQLEIKKSQNDLETISSKLIKKGIIETSPNVKNPYIFLHGQSNLLKDEIISKDLDQIRNLFDEIEKKSSFVDILETAGKAKGVQIFIGSKNFLFKHSGLSMVMAPYKNNDQEIIGAIGVVGPTRLNYSKIVPLVDYTSKIIGKVID
jgi:heat-inducible transcriptional repressor